MTHKGIIVAGIVFILIVLGMLFFAYLKISEERNVVQDILRIRALSSMQLV